MHVHYGEEKLSNNEKSRLTKSQSRDENHAVNTIQDTYTKLKTCDCTLIILLYIDHTNVH